MASVTSSVVNLTKTIIGAGLLAIPYAFKSNGIVLGTLLVVLAGVASIYGLWIVTRVSEKVKGQTSFFALCAITYPRLTPLFDLSITIQCFGVSISYLVLFGDLVPTLVNEALSRSQVIVLSLVVIIPLVSLRKLDSLKFGSMIGLTAIAYLTMLVVSHVLVDDLKQTQGHIKIFEIGSTSDILSSFSIIIFAFTAAQNICTITNEINDRKDLTLVILAANFIAGGLFLLVGLSGYIQFGDNVGGNVILQYDPSLFSSKVGKYALVLMVALSYPLMFHPCRISINNMVHWIELEYKQAYPDETQPLLADETHSVTTTIAEETEVPFSDKKFLILTILLLAASYGLALSIKSFEFILALVGATGSTLICFILPGLFGFKLFESQKEKSWSLALSVFGVLVMVTSVFATLYYN